MSLFEPGDRDHPGLIFNPDSPFWHKVDFDNLPDTDGGLSNELAFVSSAVALWLATLGFGIHWFPPDPANVCPLPAWMIADAYERLDQGSGNRPSEYWQQAMEEQALKAYGSPDQFRQQGLTDFLETFVEQHGN